MIIQYEPLVFIPGMQSFNIPNQKMYNSIFIEQRTQNKHLTKIFNKLRKKETSSI